MSVDEQSPIHISISSTAKGQLDALLQPDPLYPFEPTHPWQAGPQILAHIETRIATWSPRSERGGDGVIKWCEQISLHCNTDIYRLKCADHLDQWRIFFFLLDLDTPPIRHVEEIVEWQSNQQCYNDMTQPHVERLRKATGRFKIADRLRLMR